MVLNTIFEVKVKYYSTLAAKAAIDDALGTDTSADVKKAADDKDSANNARKQKEELDALKTKLAILIKMKL